MRVVRPRLTFRGRLTWPLHDGRVGGFFRDANRILKLFRVRHGWVCFALVAVFFSEFDDPLKECEELI